MTETTAVSHILYLSEVSGRNPFSGAEVHVLQLLSSLAAAGADVELIALLWKGDDYPQVSARLSLLREQGVKVTSVRRGATSSRLTGLLTAALAWAQLWRLLRQRRSRIVHVHLDLVFTPVVAAAARCRALVVSLHNDEPAYRRPLLRQWLHAVDHLVGAYIAITHHVHNYYVSATCIDPSKVHTVYYGFDAPTADGPSRADLGLPAKAYIVGFVGRLTEQKGLDLLITAVARQRDVLCVLVGDGPLEGALRRQAEELAPSSFRFLGALPKAAQVMPTFDLLCLPSRWEGLGVVLIEAMMRGVPVAASDRGAIPEVLGYGEYGRLFSLEIESMIDALDEMRNDPAGALRRAEAARAFASTTFAVDRMVAETLDVYSATRATAPS